MEVRLAIEREKIIDAIKDTVIAWVGLVAWSLCIYHCITAVQMRTSILSLHLGFELECQEEVESEEWAVATSSRGGQGASVFQSNSQEEEIEAEVSAEASTHPALSALQVRSLLVLWLCLGYVWQRFFFQAVSPRRQIHIRGHWKSRNVAS